MGTDARVRYTKKVIRDAFLSLLREKAAKQITVTELCQQAEINRATFYKHYRDIFDLLERIEAEVLEHIQNAARQIQGEDATVHFIHLLENVREHYGQYVSLGSERGDPHFAQEISACLFAETQKSIFLRLPDLPEEQKQNVCRFLEGGGSRVLEHWVKTGMKEEPAVLARLIFELSDAAMKLSGI